MATKREILLSLIGKETVSGAAGKAGKSVGDLADKVDDLGDEFSEAARDGERLDRQILETELAVKALANEIRRTGDLDLFKELNRQQRTLGKLTGLRQSFAEAGSDGANVMTLAFLSRVGPVLARAPLSGTLSGPLAAALAPLAVGVGTNLAGVVSAGILAGVGSISVAGGLALAFRDPAIRAEGERFGQFVADTLEDSIGEAFKPAARVALAELTREVGRLRPELARLGDVAAGFTVPLTRGLTGLVREALPGLTRGLEKSGALFLVLEQHGARLGRAIGDSFEILADGSSGAAIALADLLTVLEFGVRTTALFTRGLTGLYEIARSGGNIKELAVNWAKSDSAASGLKDQLAELAAGLGTTSANLSTATVAQNAFTSAMQRAHDVANAVVDGNLSAAESQLRLAQTTINAAAAIDKHRAVSLDEKSALLDLARATNDQTTALEQAHTPTATLTAATETARRKFIDTATKMGYTREQARQLAAQYLKIPAKVNTTVTAATAAATSAVRTFQRVVDALHGKTVTITVRENTAGLHYSGSFGGGTQVRAHGGPVTAKQTYLVGEQGPELFRPNVSGTIIPNNAMGRGGGGGGTAAPVVIFQTSGTGTDRAMADLIAALINRGAIRLSVDSAGQVRVAGR